MLKKISYLLGISFLLSTQLLAQGPQFNWSLFQSDLKEEMRRFDGNWSAENHWRKFGCNGAYHVNVDGGTTLNDIKFEVQENGSAKITAFLTDGVANVRGDYRGASTFCQAVAVGFVVRAYDIVFESDIYQAGTEEKPEIKVVVRKTRFGRIVLGKHVPDWVNQLVTTWVNRGLSAIWESSIGTKLNNLISKNLNRYLTVN